MQVREFRIGRNIEELFSNSLRNLRRIPDVFGRIHMQDPVGVQINQGLI
jgi:hypothetical protein